MRARARLSAADLVTALRVLAVPVLYALAWRDAGAAFRVLFPLAVATDGLDGWLARRAEPTARGRYLDSIADALFYTSIPLWMWRLHPEVVRGWWPWILPGAALYAAGVAVKVSRGRLIAALHLQSTRAAGALGMVYLIWELWGRVPDAVVRGVLLILTAAALIELREALRLPRAAPGPRMAGERLNP